MAIKYGGKIKHYREARGMPQWALADAVGVSQQAIGNYEVNLRYPSSDLLARIADTLGVSMDALRE
jgi:transcriptional regulator with XRE-family HTH domain